MKQYKIYSALILLFSFLSSCNKFLDVKPVGQTAIPVLFSDMEGIRAAVPGAYAKTYDYYSNHFYLYPELAGDLLLADVEKLNEGTRNIYNFNSDPDNEVAPSAKIWSDILAALANVNNALFYLPSLQEKYPSNRSELDIYRAELLFLRALCHFDLCRSYAQAYTFTPNASHIGVPVLKQTPGPDDIVDRKSVHEVYEFVLQDLKEAEQIYNSDRLSVRTALQRPYFASKDAVQALLSRVYLYMENWEQTIYYAGEVIKSKPLAKDASYVDMYFSLANPETETIFRLNGLDKGSSLLSFYSFGASDLFIFPGGSASINLTSLFEEGTNDLRFNSLFVEFVNDPTQPAAIQRFTRKFNPKQIATDNNRQHANPIVLRASEMYLNRAEAYIATGQSALAAADIKALQARAQQLVNQNNIVLPENDLNAMQKIVYEERMRELAFEGHRLFDITRRKQNLVRGVTSNSTVKELTYPNDYFVLPIPQRELDANTAMKGNPTVNNN